MNCNLRGNINNLRFNSCYLLPLILSNILGDGDGSVQLVQLEQVTNSAQGLQIESDNHAHTYSHLSSQFKDISQPNLHEPMETQ